MKHLVIDTSLFEESAGAKVRVLGPERHRRNPVIRAEFPWEGRDVSLASSVLYDSQSRSFKAWYLVRDNYGVGPFRAALCHAESQDGLSWRKPFLHIIDYKGTAENNLVFRLKDGGPISSPCVMLDKDAEEENRFKLLFWGRPKEKSPMGLCVADSKDGLRWTLRPGCPFFTDGSDTFRTCPHPEGKGVILFQTEEMAVPRFDHFHRDERPGVMRFIARRESADYERWSEKKTVLMPDHDDPSDVQFLTMAGYPWEGSWQGLVGVLHTENQSCEIGLAVGKDLRNWTRDPSLREPFLSLGGDGAFDSGGVEPACAPLLCAGDQMLTCYTGYDAPRDVAGRIGAMGVARSRRDGFVCLVSKEDVGFALTRPLLVTGESLHVNVNSIAGYLIVEVLDEEGRPIEALGRQNAVPLTQDSLNCRTLWRSRTALTHMVGKRVRLRFWMHRARLYSFWFHKSQ